VQRIIKARRRDRLDRYHDDDDNDRFPAFTSNIIEKSYPKDFKPVGIPKCIMLEPIRGASRDLACP
jgi:hypothetical protein